MDINPAGPLHYMSLCVPCLSCARFVPVLNQNQNVYVGLSIGVSSEHYRQVDMSEQHSNGIFCYREIAWRVNLLQKT